jgi:hypothetical protein
MGIGEVHGGASLLHAPGPEDGLPLGPRTYVQGSAQIMESVKAREDQLKPCRLLRHRRS